MEKMGIVKSGITPELNTPQEIKQAGNDCVKSNIVDNCNDAAAALDADFRKKAAGQVANKLDT